MRLGVSLAGFAVAAETTNVAGRASSSLPGPAARPRLGVVRTDGQLRRARSGLGGGPGRSPDLRRHRGGVDLSPAPADTRVCG